MTITELDESLRQFYAEPRNKKGENYSRRLQRYSLSKMVLKDFLRAAVRGGVQNEKIENPQTLSEYRSR